MVILAVVEIHKEVFQLIDELITKRALERADGIHLSTTLWFTKETKGYVIFVASDPEMLKAARAEKLGTCNPGR